jgi:hypothetical protein
MKGVSERGRVFHVVGFPFLVGSKTCADRSGGDGEPRGDGKALAKTQEAQLALPEGIRSLTPEMLDFSKMKHRTLFMFSRDCKEWVAKGVS